MTLKLKFFKMLLLLSFLFLTDCRDKNSTLGNGTSEDHIEITPSRANLVAEGASVQLSALLRKASGEVVLDAKFVWTSDDPSIFTVDQNGLAKGLKVGIATVIVTSDSVSEALITGSTRIGVMSSQQGASVINLSGSAFYQDKPFDENGFTGEITLKPVRKAVIELVAIEGFETIAIEATNAFGDFNITADNSTRRGGIYLRVLSTIDPDDLSKIEIQNNNEAHALYSFLSPGMDDSDNDSYSASHDLVAKTDGSGGAFNLLDVFLNASEFVREAGPCPAPNTDCLMPKLTGYWEPDSDEGSFFVPSQNEIYILGKGENDDADEYDDAVILHEFGHFALKEFSKDDSPGGKHGLLENDQDIRLSWSEGWANFFSSAVRGTAMYVDTLPGGTLLSFDIEQYTTTPASPLNVFARYTTSEIAVAGVLWDILDPISTKDKDPLALGFGEIWQTTMSFSPFSPATMETFWLQFKDNVSTAPFNTEMQNIMTERKIELFPIDLEVEELEDTAQHHTLYLAGSAPAPEGDEDIIPFAVNNGLRYTIQTFDLSNGADTLLTIREENGTLVKAENDNASGQTFSNCSSACPPNGKTNLASSVSFLWNGGDGIVLNAHIERSSIAPPSAARFGSYDINLEVTQ